MTVKTKTEPNANCREVANEGMQVNRLRLAEQPAKLTAKTILRELTDSDIMELKPRRNSVSYHRNIIYELWAEDMEKMVKKLNTNTVDDAKKALMIYSSFNDASEKILKGKSDEERIEIKTGIKFGAIMNLIIEPYYGEDIAKRAKYISVSAYVLANADGVGELGRVVMKSDTTLGKYMRELLKSAHLLRKPQAASGNELEAAA